MSKYCGICDEHIRADEAWSHHSSSDEHRRQLQRRENTIELEVLGTWEHWGINRGHILNIFLSCGPIVKIVLTSKMVPEKGVGLVEFSTCLGVTAALNQTYYKVQGQMVKVSRWTAEKQKNAKLEIEQKEKGLVDESEQQFKEQMLLNVRKTTSTEDQMRTLSSLQEPPDSMTAKAAELTSEIEAIIKDYVPDASVHMIGSYVSGLGTRGSSIDIEVSLAPNQEQTSAEFLTRPPPLPEHMVKQAHLSVVKGRVEYKKLKNLHQYDQTWFIYEILNKSSLSHLMSQLGLRIKNMSPGNHEKYISFRHLKLQTVCVIYVIKHESVRRRVSRLQKMLVELDDRIRPLYLCVRLWAQHLNIYETFHSYGLFMLVYMYLQSVKPPVLPSPETLSKMLDASERVSILNFDVSFCEDLLRIRLECLCPQNTQSLPNLLHGFFKFYTKFDISNRVFCPRTAKSYNMLKFRNMRKLFEDVNKFQLEERRFHIQDLFCTHKNITNKCSAQRKRHICREFLRAAAIFKQRENPGWSLLSLVPPTLVKKYPLPRKSAPIVIPFDALCLPEGFLAYTSYTEAEGQWYQWVVEMIMRLLKILRIQYVLAGDFGQEEESEGKKSNKRGSDSSCPSNQKRPKTEEMLDFYSCYEADKEVLQSSQLHCRDETHLWRRGRSPRETYKGNPFTFEERVTEKQLKVPPKVKIAPFEFFLTIKHVKSSNESHIEVDGEAACLTGFFVPCMNFLQEFVLRVVARELGMDINDI